MNKNEVNTEVMETQLWWGWIFMAALAIVTAVYAVPPYMRLDPALSRIPLNTAFGSHLFWLFVHALPGGIALVIGPFQFLPISRRLWPKAHRFFGKVYLGCVLLGSVGALSSMVVSTAGFAAQIGFCFLTAGWLNSAYRAYRAARKRQFDNHRNWMMRNYALTFAAVLLRIFLFAGLALRQIQPLIPFDQIYTASVWSSFVVSALMAEWLIAAFKKPGRAGENTLTN